MRQRPKLGQNFLVSAPAQMAIVDALGDVSAKTVVEIGPGRGAITSILAARAQRLVAVELDRAFAARLHEEFTGRNSVEILEQDVLLTDFAALRENQTQKLAVIGNLPYYITSDILLRLFANADAVDRAVLMVQREVADRLAAQPGSRDYGVLTVTAQMYARVEKLMTLPPEAFAPAPRVDSTVVRLTMAPRFEELGVEPADFSKFVRGSFAQKRKMLAKNLRNAGFEGDRVTAALAVCEIPLHARAEEVSVEKLARLRKKLKG